MSMFAYITIIIAAIALVLEFRRQLMMLQQNSYRNERYARWLSTSQDSTSTMRLITGAVLLASLSTLSTRLVSLGLISLVSIINICILGGKKYKKPLVMTKRATRILTVMLILTAIPFAVGVGVCLHEGYPFDFCADIILAAFCFSQCFTMAANWLLKPVEANINRKYYQDAERILRGMPDLNSGIAENHRHHRKLRQNQHQTLSQPHIIGEIRCDDDTRQLQYDLRGHPHHPRISETLQRSIHCRNGSKAARRHQRDL